MDITVEKKGLCIVNLKIVIPPEKIGEELNEKYKEAIQTITFPGFRKGKVPRKLVEKRFGEHFDLEVKQALIQEAFSTAIDEHNVEPVEEPEIDFESIEMKHDSPMEFEITVEVKPDFELGVYKDVEVEVPPIDLEDKEIEDGISALQNRFATLEDMEDGAIKKGDYPSAKLTYSVEGEEDLVREDTLINTVTGIVDGLQIPAETQESFEGKKKGEAVSFEIPALPAHFTPENLRGKAAKVAAEITNIKRVTPHELNEEFFKFIGVATRDELNNKVREGILTQKQSMRNELIEEKVIDRLVETHEFDVPKKLLDRQIMRQEYQRRMEMMNMGLPEETVEEKAGELKEADEKSSERFIRYSFIFEKIQKKEKIFVTEDDVNAEIKNIAQARAADPEKILAEFEENEMLGALRSRLRNDKIRMVLRENARIVEKEIEASSDEESKKEPEKEQEASNPESE